MIPAKPGRLVLRYAKWIPGEHGPTGPIAQVSVMAFKAAGKPVGWTRDPVDMYAIALDVPTGATELVGDVEFVLSPSASSGDFTAGTSATEALDVLAWSYVVWFPDGKPSDAIRVRPSVRLPAGWKFGTALAGAKQQGDRVEFAETTLTTLIDSPVLSGAHTKEIVLADQPKARVFVAADSEEALAVPDPVVQSWKRLVAEAHALFGARHYRSYTFLLTLSDRVPSFGLEHHESSDDRAPERVFLEPETNRLVSGLLSHEYVHSWNGKFRRPAGLAPGHYDQPMNGEALWVYEGLTEYLGVVLLGRSAGDAKEAVPNRLAGYVALMEAGKGRAWRPVADTATAAQVLYAGSGWPSRSRGVDFYPEGALFWLEVDSTIRKLTKGAKSLDDFCKAFHGIQDGVVGVVPYELDDVYATLDTIVKFDWKGLARKRLYATSTTAPTDGIDAAGWKLTWKPEVPGTTTANETAYKWIDLRWTLGLEVEEDGTIADVLPGTAADRAGLAPKMKIVAVNGRALDAKRFREAVAATKTRPGIELVVTQGDIYKTVRLDAKGGPRYPWLERAAGKDDLLTPILAPRTK